MHTENLHIDNTNNERLHAILELPANKKPLQYAIFAHCFTCSGDLGVVRNISRELTNFGFGVLRFDFTGLGGSEGDFADTNFSHNLEDLVKVHDHLANHYMAPSLLVGHSLGGAAALVAAAQLDAVRAVATIGAPSNPQHVRGLFSGNMEEILTKGQAKVDIGGRSFVLKKQFIEDLEKHNMQHTISNLKKPLLLLHSPGDTIVGIHNAAEIYGLARHPKSFISLDGADHLLSNKKDSLYAARVISTWAERYLMLESREEEVMSTRGEQVVAHWKRGNGFTTQISNNRHTTTADEPIDAGGADLGFSPYELLTAALGACTAMTLKLYAEKKGWPLDEVYAYATHSKKHIEDCGESTSNGGRIDHIQKKLELFGDLTEQQRKRLEEIASKCPVHKTLIAPVRIETT